MCAWVKGEEGVRRADSTHTKVHLCNRHRTTGLPADLTCEAVLIDCCCCACPCCCCCCAAAAARPQIDGCHASEGEERQHVVVLAATNFP